MKIAIISDSHDHYENLKKAVDIANERGCELMLHAGDLGAPGSCLKILGAFKGSVKMTAGNNDHEEVKLVRSEKEYSNFEFIKTSGGGYSYEATVDGVKIFMQHYPRISELAARSGQFDLCIFGHTHKYHEEKIGDTLLINPSSVNPYGTTASFIIFDTQTRKVEKVLL